MLQQETDKKKLLQNERIQVFPFEQNSCHKFIIAWYDKNIYIREMAKIFTKEGAIWGKLTERWNKFSSS